MNRFSLYLPLLEAIAEDFTSEELNDCMHMVEELDLLMGLNQDETVILVDGASELQNLRAYKELEWKKDFIIH